MNQHDITALIKIFDEASVLPAESTQHNLCHRHMLALSDVFIEWAFNEDVTIEQTVKLVGQAKAMQQIAYILGEEWNPPTPERIPFTRFIAMRLLGEDSDD